VSTKRNIQVIVLNGGSSSGKSSIARELQEILPGIWLTFGVDTFIDALPGGGTSPRAGITFQHDGTITFSAEHRALERIWYSGLSRMAETGAHMILDEALLSGGAGQRRLQSSFSNVELMWAGVHCDAGVAAARESHRADRVKGMAIRQALSVHDGVTYDVEVDTTHRSPAECARGRAGGRPFSPDAPAAVVVLTAHGPDSP